jgi:hypothetical protein
MAGWRLETQITQTIFLVLFISLGADHAENTASLLLTKRVYRAVEEQRKLLDCCLRISCRVNVFTESLPSNERLF